MVFKRRDRRSIRQLTVEMLYPKGGWLRAIEYMKHRVRRLPDPPERIARGIWAGLAVTFSPFVGIHFVVGALLAWVLRGNVLAAVLTTFISNIATIPFFGWVSIRVGYQLLGLSPDKGIGRQFLQRFAEAGHALWDNFVAIFTPATVNWGWLPAFYAEIFFPYLIGGLIPGVVLASIGYYVSVPLIRAYQNRRKGLMAAKLKQIRQKALNRGGDQEG